MATSSSALIVSAQTAVYSGRRKEGEAESSVNYLPVCTGQVTARASIVLGPAHRCLREEVNLMIEAWTSTGEGVKGQAQNIKSFICLEGWPTERLGLQRAHIANISC